MRALAGRLFGTACCVDFQVKISSMLKRRCNLPTQRNTLIVWLILYRGGERQRVWLAMLLAQRNQIPLLDEPLAAPGISAIRLNADIIAGITRQAIIVIYDINMAARFCDHIIAFIAVSY